MIDALETLNELLREDKRDVVKQSRVDTREFRESLKQCTVRVAEVLAERDEARRERDEARRELADFRQRFGTL